MLDVNAMCDEKRISIVAPLVVHQEIGGHDHTMGFLHQLLLEWTFVLIGKAATSLAPVEGLPNVHLLGQKPYVSLPGYAKAFDVALLPFIVNELTLAANPLKLREYLAAGLPVVSSALPEAEKLQHILYIGRNQAHFLELIQNIIDSRKTGPQLSISQHMDSESWDAKVEELSRIVMRIEAQRAAA